jgi:hypothetical protein
MIDPTGHEVHWNPGEPEDYEPPTPTFNTLMTTRLRRALNKVEAEAEKCREAGAAFETSHPQSAEFYRAESRGMQEAVEFIRFEMGLEDIDEDG